MTLHIDFETRSELDLRKVGLYNYVRHASTDVWCMSYAIDESEPYLWEPHPGSQPDIEMLAEGVFAHNAPFELAVWNEIMVPRYGWPVLKPEQTYCTMAMCYAMGLPGNLEDAALALGLSILKDTEGRNLMLKMADRNRYPVAKPEDMKRLYAYCCQDTRVERELHKRLLPLSDKERRVWLLDYKINQRGVQIDMASAKAAVKLAETVKGQANEKISAITGGAVQSVTAVAALKEWLRGQGAEAESLAKQAVADLLSEESSCLTGAGRAALTVRQEAAKASTAKFEVMVRQAGSDGRLHNIAQYHGAANGRWAARGVQVHNLPRDMPEAETVEKILTLVRAGDYDTIDMIYGAPLSAASRCLRSFFMAPAGKRLVAGDFANVEARGVSWLSGEEWKLKAFADADAKRGPGIYELAYAKSFGVPVEGIKNPSYERGIGKVMELAFGYQGGIGAFHQMSKSHGLKVTDAKAEEFKCAWRAAHPKTKATWYDYQRASINAVLNPGETFLAGHPSRAVKFKTVGSFLWILLPSGRAICLPYPKVLQSEYGPQLTHMAVPSQDKSKIIYDPKNVSNWARVACHGGTLMGNITPAICRDLLVEVMLHLDAAGGQIVLHVHDELVLEVDERKAEGARVEMQRLMRSIPEWAKGFPLWSDCSTMQRYGK